MIRLYRVCTEYVRITTYVIGFYSFFFFLVKYSTTTFTTIAKFTGTFAARCIDDRSASKLRILFTRYFSNRAGLFSYPLHNATGKMDNDSSFRART